MPGVNVTVRIDEETKREFDVFCENVGINITTAFNMFIKATLRTRELPFTVTDADYKKQAKRELGEAIRSIQEQSVLNGTSTMTLDEINSIIADVRQQKSSTKR